MEPMVSFEDVNSRLAVPLPPEAEERVTILIGDAERRVRNEFLKCGRYLDVELDHIPWLKDEVINVVLEMVSAAIVIGPNAGARSVSSATGQESDSITYANGIDYVSFSGVKFVDDYRRALGLCFPGGPRGRFPGPIRWPEVIHRG